MENKSTALKERFGNFPKESGLTNQMRLHQGWWRANILNEEPGQHPVLSSNNICNTISNGDRTENNFLTQNAIKAVRETLKRRTKGSAGKIEEGRLFNNLLSSQPLCFNFFGELYADHIFGLEVLKTFYDDLTKLVSVTFEYNSIDNYTRDGSAFDIAFEVEVGEKKGLIGFECKYTDTFSFKPKESEVYYGDVGNKNYETYFEIYNKSKDKFVNDYFEYVQNKDFNQLFRNQLIGETLLQNRKYDFVRTGLFYYQNDVNADTIANKFKKMFTNPESFQLITYSDFISNLQRLDLSWEQREWTMLLWARYCGIKLSRNTTEALNID